MSGVSCENTLLADLLGNQQLFVKLQTAHTFKNSENVVKNCAMESGSFFQNDGRI